MKTMIYVVGSGPAGVACASALMKNGNEVTLLDAGIALEKERRFALDSFQDAVSGSSSTGSFSSSPFIRELKEGTTVKASGVSEKLCYGSNFPYRPSEQAMAFSSKGVDCVPSYGRGGMSNVWGSAILPYRDEDLRGAWPISSLDLAPHYAEVLSILNGSLESDELEDLFPLYSQTQSHLPMSAQGKRFLTDLRKTKPTLNENGIHFGRSRLAVREGCAACGMCLYGCPLELIYNSAHTLGALCKEGLHYKAGVTVERIKERSNEVVIEGVTGNGKRETWTGSRVYLACGVIPSTAILLKSMDAYDQWVDLKDSQYFIFPFFRYRSTPRVQRERLHTLAQLFLEVLDPEISPRTAHFQFYSYNDLYVKAIRSMWGAFFPLVSPLLSPLLGRLWAVQSYLHSDDSSKMSLCLRKGSNGIDRIEMQGQADPHAKIKMKRALQKLNRNRKHLKGVALTPLLKSGQPGKGYHFGGSFPMESQPNGASPFQSDLMGRPNGFQRTHLVDASVFPSVPATTITLTVMANAHRIGSINREEKQK